jgi:RNA polymerase sigma factor (sigma-70 family)
VLRWLHYRIHEALQRVSELAAIESDHLGFISSLVAKHGEQVHRYLSGRADNLADVADLCQEVYMRMLRVQDRGAIRSLEAYLITVAQNVLLRHASRQAAHPPVVDLAVLNADEVGQPVDPVLEVSAQQCLERLQQALDALPVKARTAFLMSRHEGLSFDEIAERLGTSRAMAKKYLMQALGKLRRQIERSD